MRYAVLMVVLLGCATAPAPGPVLPFDQCSDSRPEQHPSVVHLILDGVRSCTGVIISQNEIATAGHCVTDKHTVDVLTIEGSQYSAKSWVSGGLYGEDIAVLHMGADFHGSPVEIAPYSPKPGDVVQIVGYGCDPTHKTQGSRHAVILTPKVSQEKQELDLLGCACGGDSGSPAFDSSGRVVLIQWGSDGVSHTVSTDATALDAIR